MRLFLESEAKRAARKLAEVNATASDSALQTPFQSLYLLARSELAKPKLLPHYLYAMRNSHITCDNMLKYCVLLHIYIQNEEGADPFPLQEFFAHLLQLFPQLIESYSADDFKRDKSADKTTNTRNKSQDRSSRTPSPPVSSRSDSAFACKELYLLTHIVKPYIAYLLKFSSSQAALSELSCRREGPRGHEAWMLINLLKLVVSVTAGFTVIGRYFLNAYGHLVILLTKALARDINKIMPSLAAYVFRENERLTACREARREATEEFVRLLEEISELNE